MSGALNDHPVAPYLASKETRLRLKLPWRHGVFDGAYPELVLAAKRFTGASPKGHRRSLREIARELAAMGFINKRRAVLGIVRQVDAEWFRNTLDTIKAGTPAMAETLGYNGFPRGEPVMVKHGALTKSHVYHLLRSNDARVRHAAFTLLERSNPTLRRDSQLFVEITRFIWDANPSYDVYNEFTKRHFQANYKVHELISARLKTEKQNKQSGAEDDLTADTRPHVYEGGFFKRLFRRRSSRR